MTCFLLGSLSGCASSPVEIPTWDELTPASVEIQRPVRLPEIPSPASSTEDTVTFTREDFQQLLAYTIAAGGNYDVAQENADSLEALSRAYNHLIEAGKMQQQFTQIREEQLQQERRDHFIDNWFHRGLIALGILVAL
jgi:hypothetical protein